MPCARLLLVVAAALPAFCQVHVDLRTSQAAYLVGEPIFVVVDVKNVGTEPVGYSYCDGHVDLTVPPGRKKQAPNLLGCFSGSGGGIGCGTDYHPMMQPGQTVSFWYLLKGYNLSAGDYVLHASGKYEGSLRLTVKDATEAQLRQRYASYVADAEGSDWELRARAREAIAEMAPPFLEKTLLGFADQPDGARLAVEGLAQIPTRESRRDLVGLFDKSADLQLRAGIAGTLAGIATAEEVPFFSSLLAGRSTQLDDQVRTFAARGLGRLGGKDAVNALEGALQSPNPRVRASVALALGNTRDPGAVPLLIAMYADRETGNDVCSALITLTHYQWCDGTGTVEVTQARWRAWWQSHASQVPLYGTDQCPAFGAALPLVK